MCSFMHAQELWVITTSKAVSTFQVALSIDVATSENDICLNKIVQNIATFATFAFKKWNISRHYHLRNPKCRKNDICLRTIEYLWKPGIDNTQWDELYCVLYVFVFIMYYILYYFRICSLKNTPKIRLYYVLYCVLYVLCINTYFVLSDPGVSVVCIRGVYLCVSKTMTDTCVSCVSGHPPVCI